MQHAQQLPLNIPGARHGRFAMTAAALARHDAAMASFEASMEAADIPRATADLERVDALKREVCDAFWRDTSDVNDRLQCAGVMSWPAGEALVRRCVGGAA